MGAQFACGEAPDFDTFKRQSDQTVAYQRRVFVLVGAKVVGSAAEASGIAVETRCVGNLVQKAICDLELDWL